MLLITTIIVGPDGEIFDLGEGEFPPQKRDGNSYIPVFGTTETVDDVKRLKRLSNKEVMQHYKMSGKK